MMSSSTGGGSKAEGGEGAAGGEGEGAEALTGEPVGEQPNTAPEPMKPPPATEKATGPTEEHEFQAETRRLLDIVASSLYSDKEVCIFMSILQLSIFPAAIPCHSGSTLPHYYRVR